MDVSKENCQAIQEKFEEMSDVAKTPSRKLKEKTDPNTPNEMQQTPRRSTRKSVKPLQDYGEIVSQTMRSAKKSIILNENCDAKYSEIAEQQKPKWIPSDVGRRSSTRRSRKSRRTSKNKGIGLQQSNDMEYSTTEDEDNEQNKINSAGKENNLGKISEDVEEERENDEDKENEESRDNGNELKEHTQILAEAKPEYVENHQTLLSTEYDNKSNEESDHLQSLKEVEKNFSTEQNINNEKEDVRLSVKQDGESHNEESAVNQNADKHIFGHDNLNEKIVHIEGREEDKKANAFDAHKTNAECEQSCVAEDSNKDVAKTVQTVEGFKANEHNIQEKEKVIIEEETIPANIRHNMMQGYEEPGEFKPKKENIFESHVGTSLQTPIQKQENFGSYLKTNNFDMKDLGLNPLEEEAARLPEQPQNLILEEISNEPEKSQGGAKTESATVLEKLHYEDNEMPSLIYCDDDDTEDDGCDIESEKPNFSVIVIEDEDESAEDIKSRTFVKDDEKQTFDLTDDKIEDLTKTPVKSEIPKPDFTEKETQTPSTSKNIKMICRFPTPYSNKLNPFPNKVKNYEEQQDSLEKIIHPTVTVTNTEPKEAVLRGIRKRSLSLCLEGFATNYNDKSVRQQKVVSFHTATIDDSQKEMKKKKPNMDTLINLKDKNVTKRRKRSMSLDEIINRIPKLTRTGQITPKKNEFTTSSRTKLPNFAAIHERHFQKMESVVDHVARKKERSKLLINSATKQRQLSAQKVLRGIPASKGTKLTTALNCDANTDGVVPKQQQQLPLGIRDARMAVVKPFSKDEVTQNSVAILSNATATNVSTNKPMSTNEKKVLKSNQTTVGRALLATAAPSTSVDPSMSNGLQAGDTLIKQQKQSDKSSTRLQRHMDLFKSRKPPKQDVKNDVVIRGVRSNRRFELQMQHRRNLEK
uniref:Uncharacterized protein n=1 Tax=Glossina austeni TaxID=7395 RepID=A0A1A9VQX8_GLOAU